MAPEWTIVCYDACVQDGFDLNLSHIFWLCEKNFIAKKLNGV